jgi:F0F1-type ATP synthase membrane subunit c/vacuolar-type H+-ATPase subunit K
MTELIVGVMLIVVSVICFISALAKASEIEEKLEPGCFCIIALGVGMALICVYIGASQTMIVLCCGLAAIGIAIAFAKWICDLCGNRKARQNRRRPSL